MTKIDVSPFPGWKFQREPGSPAISSAWLINDFDLSPQLVASQMSSGYITGISDLCTKRIHSVTCEKLYQRVRDPGPHLSLCV